MKRIVIAAAMSLCVVSLAAIASADTLVLKDGTRVPGRVVSVAARTITFEDASGVSRRYNANQVTRSNSGRRVERVPPSGRAEAADGSRCSRAEPT